MKGLLYIACLTASVSAAVTGVACNANNCLRAVRATNVGTTRTVDCQSYLALTVTPAPVIVHITNTFLQTSTTTVGVVQTNTLHETTLATQRATSTTDVPGATTTVISVVDLQRRLQIGSPLEIPKYASACGTAQYSSACSCIGATATTVVLAPETVTSYYDYTMSSLSTATTTTATTDLIVIDSTSTVTTTDSTQTVTVPSSTATVVTTVPLRQNMAIKLVKVTDGQSLGYLQPASPRNALYGGVGPRPYKFFFTDDGVLNSATGKVGIQYYSDFHSGALSETISNFKIMYPTLNPDRTITGWGLINGPVPGTATFTTWYDPAANDRYTVFVNGDVPISAPANVGWVQVKYVAEPFLG